MRLSAGHGEVSTVGDIRAEHDYLKEIEERVRQVIADGGAADAAANIPGPAVTRVFVPISFATTCASEVLPSPGRP